MAEQPLADVIVLFGGTGDLAQKMLFPSLYNLDADGFLGEGFGIIATARAEMTREAFVAQIKEAVSARVGGGGLEVADTGKVSDAALIADARTSLPRALDALEAVLAPHQLHEVPGGQRWCLHCGGDWPCPTVDAAETALRADS